MAVGPKQAMHFLKLAHELRQTALPLSLSLSHTHSHTHTQVVAFGPKDMRMFYHSWDLRLGRCVLC